MHGLHYLFYRSYTAGMRFYANPHAFPLDLFTGLSYHFLQSITWAAPALTAVLAQITGIVLVLGRQEYV